ncbi:MAG: hypothetical protein ACLRP4_08215 [Dialister invisus]
MRLWTEGIVSQVKAFLPAGGRKTVVMAAAGRLWLAEMEKGKYLVKKSAALPKITEESLAEAFSSLSGIGEREIILIYNSPDLHTACRTFPAMAEEELAETMYWEQDRILASARTYGFHGKRFQRILPAGQYLWQECGKTRWHAGSQRRKKRGEK